MPAERGSPALSIAAEEHLRRLSARLTRRSSDARHFCAVRSSPPARSLRPAASSVLQPCNNSPMALTRRHWCPAIIDVLIPFLWIGWIVESCGRLSLWRELSQQFGVFSLTVFLFLPPPRQ